jgi:hypothetical protein
MPTRADAFFASIVKPTVDEFYRDSLNIRRGFLAAIVLYHMADYWNQQQDNPTDESLKTLRKSLIQRCPDFGIIGDVANAAKHDRLTRGQRQLSSSEQVNRTEGALIGSSPLGTALLGEASFVMFTLDDGTSRPLIGAVRSVLLMWEAMLQ